MLQFLLRSNSSMDSESQRRGSTSHTCLHKILTIIATIPPPLAAAAPPCSAEDEPGDENKPSGFDLNVVVLGMSSSNTTALECDGSAGGGGGCFDVDNGGDRVENSQNRIDDAEKSLSLLIEAAKVIFGVFMENDESEMKNDEVAAEIREEFGEPPSSPVVRSKRGRTQVLPGRYRDSVLEPPSRFSRTRSSIVASKRRRR